MGLSKQKILGVDVSIDKRETILEEIEKRLDQTTAGPANAAKKTGKPYIVVTPNPEQVVYAVGHERFRTILNWADAALPDGIGLVWASRHLSAKPHSKITGLIPARIPGVEFMEDLSALAAKRGVTIGLIGGRGSVAVKALECLQQKNPSLKGWVFEAPELAVCEEEVLRGVTDHWMEEVVQKILSTDTRILFVGLGAPKQEYLIEDLSLRLARRDKKESIEKSSHRGVLLHHPLVMMAVGGSFDIVSSTIQRAPLLFRSIGFEWFWRLIQQPWRWKRQLALLRFVWMVLLAS